MNIRFFICLLILINSSLGSCFGNQNQEPKKKTFKTKTRLVLKHDEGYGEPRLSPDGTKISYKRPYNGIQNIWIKTVGSADDRMVTHERLDPVGSYCWSVDGSCILYRRDRNGDERYHLYKVDINSGRTTDLTPYADAHIKIIKMSKRLPNEIAVELRRNGSEWGHNNTKPDAYRINIESGSFVKVATNPGNVIYWVADQDLKIRASCAYDYETISISTKEFKKLLKTKTPDELYDMFQREHGCIKICTRLNEKEEWTEIRVLDISSWVNTAILGFTSKGDSLYLLDSKESDTNRLIILDSTDGTIQEEMAHDDDCDLGIMAHISDPGPFVIDNPKTGEIQAILCNKDVPEWKFFDEDLKSDFQAIINQLGRGFIELVSRDSADKKWIISFCTDKRPLTWYLFDRTNQQLQSLFQCQDTLSEHLCDMQPISFTARDGVKIRGYITYPHLESLKQIPLVLLVHGGPYSRDNWSFNSEVQWLASQGYAVMQINYRGSSTYGKNFAAQGLHWKAYGTIAFNDLVDGVEWAIKEEIADSHKIAIMGTSQGGYEALCGATYGSNLFCCAVDICGPSNWELFVSPPQSDDKEMSELLKQYWNKIKPIIHAVSPVFATNQVQHPILIAHGRYDTRVSIENTQQFINGLDEFSKKYQALVFEDEGHIIHKSDNMTKLHTSIENFLSCYLAHDKITNQK